MTTTSAHADEVHMPRPMRGAVRVLSTKEGELLREHLMRLDARSRHDRFNGFVDDEFLAKYAARSIHDGTVIVAYLEDGKVRGAAELHQPDLTPGSLAEIAFSVEDGWRRKGLGAILFAQLIEKARALGYTKLRITTGSENDAMRALARKFGAHLSFRHGESTGIILIEKLPKPPVRSVPQQALDAWSGVGRAWWKATLAMYGSHRH